MVLLAPSVSEAFDIVFDPSNFGRNSITAIQTAHTAARMAHQIRNSDAEVRMMIKNLLLTGGSYYPMHQYLALLQEVIDSQRRGEPLHYYLADLDGRQRDLYRGYTTEVNAPGWSENYDLLTETNLNVQRGMLNTVQAELTPADDEKLDQLLRTLREKTEFAPGNLHVSQVANYLHMQHIQEARRQRHMLGALTNALTVQNQHETNLAAWTQRVSDQFIERGAFALKDIHVEGGIGFITLDR